MKKRRKEEKRKRGKELELYYMARR